MIFQVLCSKPYFFLCHVSFSYTQNHFSLLFFPSSLFLSPLSSLSLTKMLFSSFLSFPLSLSICINNRIYFSFSLKMQQIQQQSRFILLFFLLFSRLNSTTIYFFFISCSFFIFFSLISIVDKFEFEGRMLYGVQKYSLFSFFPFFDF